MKNKKIMFFDIDGTLLPFKHKTISDRTREALVELRANDILVGIATGRSSGSYPKIFGETAVDFMITSNGREVSIAGKDIFKQVIPTNVVEKLIKFDEKYRVGLNYSSNRKAASYYGTTEKGIAYLANLHEIEPTIDKTFHLDNDILQAMIYCDEATEKIFVEAFPELAFVRHKNDGIDVLSAGPMKEKGIEIVLDYYGLTPEDALAFGDGLNDYGMFEYIDGVALGVAHPDLEKIAKRQIGQVEEDGIYHYLKKLEYI